MKIQKLFQSYGPKIPLWLIAIGVPFLLAFSGCSAEESAIETPEIKTVATPADNLGLYSSRGDLPALKLLLDAGIDVNAKDSRGSNALIAASWAGQEEVVLFLLNNKADVNLGSSDQLTPLGAAVGQNREAVALLLLEHGADPNVVNSAGGTPLMDAAWQGNASLVRALLEKGANPNYKRPEDGLTALKAARGKQDIVQAIKAAGNSG